MRSILSKLNLFLAVTLLACICIMVSEQYLTAYIDTRLKKEAGENIHGADISWQSLETRLLHLDIVLHQAEIRTASGYRIGVDRIFLDNTFKFPMNSDYMTFKMDGIQFHHIPGFRVNTSEEFNFFNLYTRKMSLQLEFFFDPLKHYLDIKKLILNNAYWGRLQLKLVLNQFYPEKILGMELETLQIQAVDLKYEDKALLKTFAESYSEKLYKLREFMEQAVHLAFDTARKKNNSDSIEALSVLKNFFEYPGQLIFTLQLNQPVNISQIMNLRRVSDLLDMVSYRFTNA